MFAADLPVTVTTPKKTKSMIKHESMPPSPVSTALLTPANERVEENPFVEAPSKSPGKRKSDAPSANMQRSFSIKRTRSTARIELIRTTSSGSAVADAVRGLEVD